MEDYTLLCHSIVKEEPIDLVDGVITVNQDESKSYNNYDDSKFLCSDLCKINARSATGDLTHQHYGTAKEEPTELMSVNHSISGAQILLSDSELHCSDLGPSDLNTILKIEEMNMDDFKTDKHFYKQGEAFKQLDETHQLQHLWQTQQVKKRTRKILKPGTMMKIAKKYADLFSNEVSQPSPYPRFTNSTVIQCPACTIPRDQSRHSAFLELLIHVTKRHSDCSHSVFYKIAWTYASFIESLKIKIFRKLKKRHSERLKKSHRSKLLL